MLYATAPSIRLGDGGYVVRTIFEDVLLHCGYVRYLPELSVNRGRAEV